jgi:polysaccharide export outer membrane protein
MRKNKLLKLWLFYLLALSLSLMGCSTRNKLVYFQSSAIDSSANISYNPIIKNDDLLSILVMASDADAAVPFNLPVVSGNGMMGGYTQGTPSIPGYLVDSNGDIDFPIVGRVHLAGMSRSDAIEFLKKALKPYLSSPTIVMRILNYKVTVLGEVKNPGTFTIPNERVTILEAIGIAGDLQITGMRDNVLVIREQDGKRLEYRIDLRSKDLFNSPVYYLTQNDIVYVEPNRAKRNSAVINATNVGVLISASSIIISLIVLITQ